MKRHVLFLSLAFLFPLLIVGQDTIKVKVETVQVYANVTDFKGRFVTNLKQGNFKILEDGKEQQIDAFSSDDSPISVGIIFDVNGFMGDNYALARRAALTFWNVGNLNDEYFVIEFNDKPQITEDYTRDPAKLANHVLALHRTKESAAIDALDLGLETLRYSRNPRKVLLMLSSGGYSSNEHKASQVRKLSRQMDVQIFGATLVMPRVEATNFDPMACGGPLPNGRCGVYAFSDDFDTGLNIIDSVGGEGGFASDSAPDFVAICRRIGVALRNQYIFGYQSTNPVHDGKYRQLELKLDVRNVPDLKVHTRDGYYALGPDGGLR